MVSGVCGWRQRPRATVMDVSRLSRMLAGWVSQVGGGGRAAESGVSHGPDREGDDAPAIIQPGGALNTACLSGGWEKEGNSYTG